MERAPRRGSKLGLESFDDMFPCKSYGQKCKLKHVWNWINLFFLHHQPEYQAFIDQIKQGLR